MKSHENIPDSQWNQVKSEITKTWNRLDAQELESTHGDMEAISALVQKRYGLNEEQVEEKLDDVIERCGTAAGSASFQSTSSNSSVSDASIKASTAAKWAGPADLGSNVDPSSLSTTINQTSGSFHTEDNIRGSYDSSSNPNAINKSNPDFSVDRSFDKDAADERDAFSERRSMSPSFDRQSASDDAQSASQFHTPEEGFDSAESIDAAYGVQRDSRAPEDFNTNEPKRYGSSLEGQQNDFRNETTGETRNSSGSGEIQRSAGSSSGLQQSSEKSARNSSGSSFSANAGDGRSSSAQNSRSSEDSSQGDS